MIEMAETSLELWIASPVVDMFSWMHNLLFVRKCNSGVIIGPHRFSMYL